MAEIGFESNLFTYLTSLKKGTVTEEIRKGITDTVNCYRDVVLVIGYLLDVFNKKIGYQNTEFVTDVVSEYSLLFGSTYIEPNILTEYLKYTVRIATPNDYTSLSAADKAAYLKSVFDAITKSSCVAFNESIALEFLQRVTTDSLLMVNSDFSDELVSAVSVIKDKTQVFNIPMYYQYAVANA